MWIVAFSGFLLYIPLFLRLRKTIREYPEQSRRQMHIARQLLVYPIAYVIIITPISVVRKIQFTNTKRMEAGEIASGKPAVAPALVGFAGVFFSLSGFVDAILYVITRPSILRSFLSSFQSNGGPVDAGAAPPANGQRQAKPALATMPEVTINSGSGEKFDFREAGFRNKGRYGGYSDTELSENGHNEIDYGLPTVTVMSANHLTPPSLRTRGTVIDYGYERPSSRPQEGTSSSGGTRYYPSYFPYKEGSSSTAAER